MNQKQTGVDPENQLENQLRGKEGDSRRGIQDMRIEWAKEYLEYFGITCESQGAACDDHDDYGDSWAYQTDQKMCRGVCREMDSREAADGTQDQGCGIPPYTFGSNQADDFVESDTHKQNRERRGKLAWHQSRLRCEGSPSLRS